MFTNEQQLLLGDKVGEVHELPFSTQHISAHKISPRRNLRKSIWGACLPFLCASALYGTYIVCKAGITQPTTEVQQGEPVQPVTPQYTCIPGQSCWPSSKDWSDFNKTINGKLRLTEPWAQPCYLNSTSEACQQVSKVYGDGDKRTLQYGSMEFLDWELCGQDHCYLNSLNTSKPMSGQCSLGRLSTYHVEARAAEDIKGALNFVRKHGIRVSIKNTGHDYFGRSNLANSLAIWTHNMKETKYHKTFQPKGCKTSYKNIGEVGAGIQADEAWTFFEDLNMLVTVGAVGSVGIAGGFGQGGGHGPLGPKYGLMVDQAVEFEVVTSDGVIRTINECTDPDLFWAMRGGGGGNYAVLTSYKFQLHPAVPINVYSFQAQFPPPNPDLTQSKLHRDIITALAMNQTTFSKEGVAGYNFLYKDHMVSLQVMPSADKGAIKKITSQWHDFLTNYPNLTISDNNYYSFDKFSDWHKFTETPAISRNGAVGVGLMEAGRFIPKELFKSERDIASLVDAALTAMQFSNTNKGGGSIHFYATGPANHPDNSKTGVHPWWRTSLWHVIMGAAWTSDTPLSLRNQIQNTISASVQPFKALTPNGGCYMNEGDWLEENWQQTFFGSNYDRLLQVKKRFDPTGMFNCWKCVGWTGYDDNMYSCYTQSRKEPVPSIPLGRVG